MAKSKAKTSKATKLAKEPIKSKTISKAKVLKPSKKTSNKINKNAKKLTKKTVSKIKPSKVLSKKPTKVTQAKTNKPVNKATPKILAKKINQKPKVKPAKNSQITKKAKKNIIKKESVKKITKVNKKITNPKVEKKAKNREVDKSVKNVGVVETKSSKSGDLTAVVSTPVNAPEIRTKRAYRKSGKKIATSEYISTKFQPSNALKDYVVPNTMFTQNGRRFGDEHRLNASKIIKKPQEAQNKYITKTDLERLRAILLEQRIRLIEGLDSAVSDLQDDMVTVADPNDRASQETDLALELRERDRETKLIRKIDSTIERMDKKDYGYCDACGVEIGMKRLEARPMANLCIDCKELQEFQEKQSVR